MNVHKKLSRLIAFAALLCSGWLFAQNASVTNAEYFWNTDPGEGNATAVQVSDGNFDEVIESLVGSNVMVPATEGYHVLYVRSRDINNTWGKSFAVVVRVNGTSISLRDAKLAQAEYFWDTDPGEGNATTLLASDGDLDEILETLTANNISTPSTLGPHVLYIRTKDAQNGWGRCVGKVITVRSVAQARNARLVNAEFFFDTDPGEGNGNPLSVFDGNYDEIIETLSGNKLVIEVDSGIHTLYVRTKDADNNWGPAFGKVVHVDSSYTNYQLNTTIEGDTSICSNELADERTYRVEQHKNASYTWSIKGGTIVSGDNTNEVTVQWISIPPYEVKVIETDGFLTDSSIVQVGFKLAPTVDAISNRNICENDTVLLTVTGNASSYTWDYDAGTGDSVYVQPDSSVTYTVTGIDPNGCSAQDQVIVTIHKAPNVITTSNRQMCIGQFITLTASGDALTYVWENGAGSGTTVMVDPKTDTMFVVKGSDAIGCSNTDTVMVKVDPRPIVDASGDITMCAGLSTDLSVTGNAISYSWNNLAGTGTLVSVSPDTTTKYTVIGTDENGCQSADTVVVEIMDRPTVVASENDTVCRGDTITLTATGNALSYSWSDGSVGNIVQVVPLTDRTYTVTGVGSNGCETKDNVALTLKAVPSVNITTNPDICLGESVSLHVSGNALSYEWSHGGGNDTVITITPVYDTTYRVTGTGENGCWNTDEATINVHPLPVVTASSADTICMEQNVVLHVTGTAETYEWDNDAGFGEDVSVSPESNTLYTVTGTDIYGCTNTDQVFVNVKPIPTVEISAIDTICGGDTIWLSVSGDAVSYTWDKGLGSNTMVEVSPHQTTTYSATGIYSNGCTNTEVITVEVIPAPIIIAGADNIICRGESTTLNVNGTALEYTWSDGLGSGTSVEVSPDQTSKYSVTGVGEFGCINSDDIVITVNSLPEVGVLDAEVNVCIGKGTLLTATGNAFSYVWSDNLGVGKSIAIKPSEDYTYTVTGIALNNCRNTAEVSIFMRDYPDTPMVYQMEHLIHTNVNEGIQWYEGEYEIAGANSKFYGPEHNGTYKVEVTNRYGCSTQSEYYEFEWTWVHVDEHSLITNVQMYPNPVQGLLTIDLGDEVPLVRVRITDLSGKEVVSGDYFNSREIKIDTYGLKTGLYIIELSDKTSKLTSKFIKQ